MKIKLLSKVLILSVIVSVFSSCKDIFNDDSDSKPKDEYLVDYQLEKSYLPTFIETLFGQFENEYPEIQSIRDKIQHGVLVYKINYNTTFKGKIKTASGLVCVPIGEGPFPIMSYQNGTNTLNSDAPSVNPDRDLYLLLEFVASTGFEIVIPDYLGFGASSNMFHPYLHRESTVQTVLDMLRAVKELNENYLEVATKDELYITGYSQGGWATMQVQKAIEQQYSGEFNLKASACGAGPYNLTYMNDYILSQTTYPMPYFVGYMLNSYVNLELIETPMDEILQQPYAGKIPTLYNGTKTGEEINAELTTTVADLFTADYVANYDTDSKYETVISTLEDNSVEAWKTTTPTMIIHGTDDEFVPMQISSNMYQNFILKGSDSETVTMVPLPGYDHTGGIVPAGLASIQWFLDMQQ